MSGHDERISTRGIKNKRRGKKKPSRTEEEEKRGSRISLKGSAFKHLTTSGEGLRCTP